MRVLHLPTDIGGNAWGLSRGERALGLQSDVLLKEKSSLGYPADIQLNIQKTKGKVSEFYKLLKTFINIRNQYDVYHFNFGSSLLHFPGFPFLNQLDLPFYPQKAKLFVTYNGCDARQKYPTMKRMKVAACHNTNCYQGMCNSGRLDQLRRLGIRKMERYVHHFWALNPDLLHFLPPGKSSFLPYSVCKFDVGLHQPKFGKKLKVIHAPSNREAKGSVYIIAALDKLRRKYPDLLEVNIIENVLHEEALNLYKQADLIIDQILIGWYGAFAVEGMLMGKPVVARISVEDLKFVPDQMALDLQNTIIQADPTTIYHVLEKCIQDRQFLKERSQASIEYANKWHHPQFVAEMTKEKYEMN